MLNTRVCKHNCIEFYVTRHIISCLHNRIISKCSFFRHHVVISRILLVTYSYQWLALLIQLQKLIVITIQHLFIKSSVSSSSLLVIKSLDTDVFRIGVACQPTIPARLIFDTGTANNWKSQHQSHCWLLNLNGAGQ